MGSNMAAQESALTLALMAVPQRAVICRALLDAGDDGLPADRLAQLTGLNLHRAAHYFREMVQAGVLAIAIRDRRVCYVLKARREVREALGYLDTSGLD